MKGWFDDDDDDEQTNWTGMKWNMICVDEEKEREREDKM